MRLAPLLAVAVLVSACADAGPLRVAEDEAPLVAPPSFALVDAASGGSVPGFYFLPPLAKSPTVQGSFDPALQPAMEVCELTGNPSAAVNPAWASVACTGTVVTYFAPGSASVSTAESHYKFSWDTDAGAENILPMDPNKFYRIRILLEDAGLGYLDVNPQQPSGETPGEDFPDLYAFRLGETLPVKVFLSPAARCATAEGYVIQCTASAVFDDNGGVLSLEPGQTGWPKLSVVLPAGALPGVDQVTMTIERISPTLFESMTGEKCIPMFDAPQFSDCLRVTTDPLLTAPLESLALIEMCIDPFALGLDVDQATRLQIVRYADTGDQAIQGLPMTYATTCGSLPAPAPDVVGLLPVPASDGLLRKAVTGVNALARALGPDPLAAIGEIRLAGATSNFSRFRWALPGQMVKEAGDGAVLQQPESGPVTFNVPVTVKVVDSDGALVEGATVHFANGDDVTTGADGLATTTWTVPGSIGTHTFTATALGLLDAAVPGNTNFIPFAPRTVTFTSTVVGPPSSYTQSPTGTLTGAPGQTISTPLVITVFDANGQPVSGWNVTWTSTCSGSGCTPGAITGATTTGADGSASATWTLSTTPGGNTATATVGGVTATWNANGVCQVTIDGVFAPNEWVCGTMRPFTASISGGSTPAEVHWQNDGVNLYLAVRVKQSTLVKPNSLRFDFDNDGLGIHNTGDDAIGYDAGAASFFDHYLTAKCASNGQSGCGSADTVRRDGAGAIGNDGTWTVYELSHPLQGTAGEDFIRSAGQNLGFFLTLRIGNGAQGNTQWPGFRIFQQTTIR